jgi:FKBP-type peptidyl-prolyl cis-trans isomerase
MTSARRHTRAVLVALPLALALACGGSTRGIPPPQPLETQVFAPALDVHLAASTRTPNGVYYRDVVAGSGAQIATGQTVSVHYTLWLPDGTLLQSGDFEFPSGAGRVIAGFDEGLIGAKVGASRQLVIPSALGYGAKGTTDGSVPPNANLVFVVKVLAIR